jgi:hypothetical protein
MSNEVQEAQENVNYLKTALKVLMSALDDVEGAIHDCEASNVTLDFGRGGIEVMDTISEYTLSSATYSVEAPLVV